MSQKLALLPLLALLQGSASAAVITFREGALPTAGYISSGATIRSDTPAANSGVGPGNIVIGNAATTGADLRAVFAFDLSAIGSIGSATINSITFSWNTGGDGTSQSVALQVDLYALTTSFAENTVTWNTPWTLPGGDFSGALLSSRTGNPNTGTSGGSLAWTFASSANFVSAAQSAFNSGGQTLYFIAKLNDESSTNRRIFQILGDENATVNLRPTLSIDYTAVPEPSVLGLLALGACLIVRRRR